MKLQEEHIAEIRKTKAASQYANMVTSAVDSESAPSFYRIIDLNERGQYKAHIVDQDGHSIYQYDNDDEEGNPTSLWLVEDGFMQNSEDLPGLLKYLIELKILPENATLYDGKYMEQHESKDRKKSESVHAAVIEWNEASLIAELVNNFGEEYREEITETLQMDKGRYSSFGDAAEVTVDGTTYNIISNEDEAARIALSIVEEDLKSEPEMFSQDFLQSYMEISDTDRHMIAAEEADAYMDGVGNDDEGIVHAAELDAEYEAAESEEAKEAILVQAKEIIYDAKYKEVSEALEDPVQYSVRDLGAYTIEDLMKANFIRIDTDKAAEEAISIDGWAHFLSHYDNNYETTANGVIFFRED
jgi:hypothetical protein